MAPEIESALPAESLPSCREEVRELLDAASVLVTERLRGAAEAAAELRRSADARQVDQVLGRIAELQVTFDNLLDLGRARLDLATTRRRRCHLAELVRPLRRSLAEHACLAGADLSWSLGRNLPTIPCEVDPLRRAITALACNALAFVGRGGSVRLAIQRSEDGAEAVLAIRDSGPGIERDDFARLWDRSQSLELARSLQGDYGLAIQAAREIVERHGGRLVLSSDPKQGNEIAICLPVAEPAASPQESQEDREYRLDLPAQLRDLQRALQREARATRAALQ